MDIRHFSKFAVPAMIACLFLIDCSKPRQFSLKDVSGFYVPDRKEELYGTWVNPNYEGGTTRSAKLVIHETGFMESYSRMEQPERNETGVMTIVKKWRKIDGSSWYITFYRSSLEGDSLGITKISKNDTVWEGFWVMANVAGGEETLLEENLTTNHPHYMTYERQAAGE